MTITFITGNAGKFSEAQTVLTGIELLQKKVELPEIQSLDAHEVMRAKLEAARAHGISPCIVEDSSLTFECLNNQLPGPLLKWFEEALTVPGLAELTDRYGNNRATGKTLVGYMSEAGETQIFEAQVAGTIVAPRGDQDFGYGPVFQPAGHTKTFGEMSREEKHGVGSRAAAFRQLLDFLQAKS